MKKLFKILFVLFWLTLCVLAFYFTYSYLWAPHIHAYGEWSVTTPAACLTEGEQTRTCECGATDTRPIPATGHTMSDWKTTTPAACETAGEQTRTCACGARETEVLPATGHDFGTWKTTKDASCTAEGEEARSCSRCHLNETKVIAATGHQPGEWQTVREVSWTEDGERQKICKTCKEATVTEAVPLTLSEGLAYTLNTDKKSYTVTGIGTCTDEVVVIPAEYNGLPVTGIGESAFSGTQVKTMLIPAGVTNITGWSFKYAHNLVRLSVAPDHPVYIDAGNCIIEKATGTLVAGCNSSVIPADGSVTIIGDAAFAGRSRLQSIEIPEGITIIRRNAFFHCPTLKSLTIPASVTEIESGVTYLCDDLISLTVSPENKVYHSAGNCIIKTAEKELITCCESSVIPTDGTVTKIGSEAFGATNITSITIPDSVNLFDTHSFINCNSLTTMTYTGTKAQWNAIKKGYNWRVLCSVSVTVHCTDGDIILPPVAV